MLSRLMTERSDLLLLFIRLKYKTALEYVLLMKAKRSTLEMKYFVRERKDPLLIMTRVMSPMMVNEADMDFRIPGLPHSVVKYAQSNSVRQLVQKIENHPDRHALQQDLPQNQSFNPFSPESKQMFRDVGKIELSELLETEPKTQCTVCLSHGNIGLLYCTCGHFLHKERGSNQQFINYTMDFLSVPEYVIKKGRPHGHRYGKKPGDREYHTANQLKKRCRKKCFQGIHDRFIRDPEFRNRIIENHRDEELCRRWDALADEDHTI